MAKTLGIGANPQAKVTSDQRDQQPKQRPFANPEPKASKRKAHKRELIDTGKQKRYVRRGKNLEACEGSDRNNTLKNALTNSRSFVIQETPEPTCKEAERLRLVNQPRAIWETAKLSSNI